MNALPQNLKANPGNLRANKLLVSSMSGLRGFALDQQSIRQALSCATQLGNITAIKSAGRLTRKLDQFEPSITMIGQIKSGKTTLVNSMIGRPDLLPADVNPWTSVVTSLHLCPHALTPPTHAVFRFFETNEWDRLVRGGGRIGELAGRAGAEDELSIIKAQAEMMREKAKARLGRKFEMLLGSQQSYGYFDEELIARYVCLGDEEESQNGPKKAQGYFADITKSADLYMQQAAFPINLCIRDTPGVNDTFMVREQITIKAIRDSRICVVVLSAHQALSSTDLALIRLISNVKSREVVIFVNRIDELSEPQKQVPQIRDSIQATLASHQGPVDTQIIFGSALWAQTAIIGRLGDLPRASQEALFDWAGEEQVPASHDGDPNGFVWELSGLPALYAAISDRIIEGEGRELSNKIAVSTRNLLGGISVADNLSAKAAVSEVPLLLPADEINRSLAHIQETRTASLEADLVQIHAAFVERVGRSQLSFLSRATEALAKHLEIYGENSAWNYDPAGLRLLLGSAYKAYGAKCQSAFKEAATLAVMDLQDLCLRALDINEEIFTPIIPTPPHIPAPVTIGQTIALDLRGSWWRGWWDRRRSYTAQAQSYYDLIKSETEGLLRDLVNDQSQEVKTKIGEHLDAFLSEQVLNLGVITETAEHSHVKIDKILSVGVLQERDERLSTAINNLMRYQA